MLAVTAVLVAACPSPGGGGNPPPEIAPPPEVALTFEQAVVRKSKMLVSTNGGAPQTYTNTLRLGTTPVTAGAVYRISANPGGHTPEEISVDAATGEVTFTKALYDKMTPSDLTQPPGPPAVITIEATYQGKTASYTFTVTDHFSPRRDYASAVLSGDLYVIGGRTAGGRSNEVWRSADGGLTWDQVAAGTAADSTLFAGRSRHTLEVIGDARYLLGGFNGTNRFDEVWTSADRGVTWRQAAATTPRYPARGEHSSAVLGGTLYVIDRLNDVWKSTDQSVTWTNGHANP